MSKVFFAGRYGMGGGAITSDFMALNVELGFAHLKPI